MQWGGVGGAQQRAATNTSARPEAAPTGQSGGRARKHERQGDDTREAKTRGGAPHALERLARPSRRGKHHRQPTPVNAGRTAAETTANQQTSRASSRLQHHEPKPEHTDTPRPTKGGGTHKHGTPQQGGGGGTHQHSTSPGPANNTTATATDPTDDDNPSQTPHRGGQAPTQHSPQREEPRSNTARPTMRGAMHQHNTNPGQANTTDNQHSTTPAVRRRRQQRTNKTSRASSPLQHKEPNPEQADTARPTKGGGTHKHGTPQHRGGHAPAQHQPRPSKQHHRNRNPSNTRRQP